MACIGVRTDNRTYENAASALTDSATPHLVATITIAVLRDSKRVVFKYNIKQQNPLSKSEFLTSKLTRVLSQSSRMVSLCCNPDTPLNSTTAAGGTEENVRAIIPQLWLKIIISCGVLK